LGQQFATFNDWTDSIFGESKLRPTEWLLVIGLWQLKLNATEIAKAAEINERTAQRCINLLDGGIYEMYHLNPERQLEGQVEGDEAYQSSGSKGLARQVEQSGREPRRRGIKLRGRATAEKGRPPILGLVQRRDQEDKKAPPAQVFLEVLENVRTVTVKPIIDTSTGPSITEQESMHAATLMVFPSTVTPWKAFGPVCAISWSASRALANVFFIFVSVVSSSFTTTVT
jgi:hypothetical protein